MKDQRIKFITNIDKEPYLFLNNKGEITYFPWFSGDGKIFGNLFNENYETIIGKVEDQIGRDAPDFFEALWGLPLFARYSEGAYEPEEVESLSLGEYNKIINLSELYMKHVS